VALRASAALSFNDNGYHKRDLFDTVRNTFGPGITWRETSALSTPAFINDQVNKDDSVGAAA
jgi:hypothetical protein